MHCINPCGIAVNTQDQRCVGISPAYNIFLLKKSLKTVYTLVLFLELWGLDVTSLGFGIVIGVITLLW